MKITTPGGIYLDKQNRPHYLAWHCAEPTAGVVSLSNGDEVGGGIYSLNLDPFRPIEDCTPDEIRAALLALAADARRLLEENCALTVRLVEVQGKLIDATSKLLTEGLRG